MQPHQYIIAKRVATAIGVILWLCSVVYMAGPELGKPNPDWSWIITTLLVNGVVCALPCLSVWAWHCREFAASAGLAVVSALGIVYTVQNTIDVQAERLDAKLSAASAKSEALARIERQLDEAQAQATAAFARVADECGTGKGRKCEGKAATVDAADDRVSKLTRALADAPQVSENAGIKRTAALLAFASAGTLDQATAEKAVTLFRPVWLPLVFELGAFFAFMFGTRPLPVEAQDDPKRIEVPSSGGGGGPRLSVVSDREIDEMRRVFMGAKKPLSNDELAGLMRIHKSESSRRVSKAVAMGLATRQRIGRNVAIQFHA